jgi:hypothetical protein
LLGACASQVYRSAAGSGKGKTGKANWAINQIQKLYALESKLKTQTFEVKQQQRQLVAAQLLQQLWDWLEKSKGTIPKESLVGKAISYTQNQ